MMEKSLVTTVRLKRSAGLGDLEGGGAGVQIDHLTVFHQAGGVFAYLALVAMVQLRLLAISQLRRSARSGARRR